MYRLFGRRTEYHAQELECSCIAGRWIWTTKSHREGGGWIASRLGFPTRVVVHRRVIRVWELRSDHVPADHPGFVRDVPKEELAQRIVDSLKDVADEIKD